METTVRGAAYVVVIGVGLMIEEDVFVNVSEGDGDWDIIEFVLKLFIEVCEMNYVCWNDVVERTFNLSA